MSKALGFVLISGMALGLSSQIMACGDGGTNTTSTSSSSSSGGEGGMGSSSGGMGGVGGMVSPECSKLSDCLATECKTPTACTNGTCEWQFSADGTEVASQLYGDCKTRVCDGMGGVKEIAGDPAKDAYDSGNICYRPDCNGATNPIANDGAPCTTPWGATTGKCSNFACVECTVNEDCPSMNCIAGRCVPQTCLDLIKSGQETDIDCGGPDCRPCAAGKTCLSNNDCEGRCDQITNECVAPSCSDNVQNADETDVDCGGSCAAGASPKKCNDAQKCLFPRDCDSGVCKLGTCRPGTCSDQTQNQGEAGVDCGGQCPLACPSNP